MAHAGQHWRAACIAAGRQNHDHLSTTMGTQCAFGPEIVEGKDIKTVIKRAIGKQNHVQEQQRRVTEWAMGNGRQQVCWHMGLGECAQTHPVFDWLPTQNVTNWNPYGDSVTVKMLYPADYGQMQAILNGMEPIIDDIKSYADQAKAAYDIANGYYQQAEALGNQAQAKSDQASYYKSKAQKYARGVKVYGAISQNHNEVVRLLYDEQAQTGRYLDYKTQLEVYAGTWACSAVADIDGLFLNNESTDPTVQQQIADYDNPLVGPYLSSPFAGGELIEWDSNDNGEAEPWYHNASSQQMAPAEKLPLYTQEHCSEGELWAKQSAGELGDKIAELHADSPYFERNFVAHQLHQLSAPINDLIEQANTQYALVESAQTSYQDSATVYWQALAYAADGQIEQAEYGNGVITDWNYDERGRTAFIEAKQGNNALQKMGFDYDALGNLTARDDSANHLYETFAYDALNRLTGATMTGSGAALYDLVNQTSQTFAYDALGNITHKSDVGDYTYGTGISAGTAGPHALIATSGTINTSFSYDANGNQISGHGRSIDYSSYNKPVLINKAGAVDTFAYGPERQLIHQTQQIGEQLRETLSLGDRYEEITENGQTKAIHHLSIAGHTVAVLKTSVDLTTTHTTHYLHQDHLNSVVMITDDSGQVVERNHYDAFGKKRLAIADPTPDPLYAAGFLPITDRGFTGHRQLPGTELIHMKGRVYDPTFGRFLSADPHIQAPLNSQSLNRYSYVLNNPLSLTDPSGYFFSWLKKLFKKLLRIIKKIIKKVIKVIKKVIKVLYKYTLKPVHDFVRKHWRIIVSIAVSWIPGVNVYAAAFLSGLVVSGGNLKFALFSVLTAGAFNLAGNALHGTGVLGKAFANASRIGKALIKGVTHGLVGGFSAVLNGGKFLAGFAATAFRAGVSQFGGLNAFGSGRDPARVIAEAVTGGIAGKLAGGKFGDSAVLAGLGYINNDAKHGYEKRRLIQKSVSGDSEIRPLDDWEYETKFGLYATDLMGGGRIARLFYKGLSILGVEYQYGTRVVQQHQRYSEDYYDVYVDPLDSYNEVGFRDNYEHKGFIVKPVRSAPIHIEIDRRVCMAGGAFCVF